VDVEKLMPQVSRTESQAGAAALAHEINNPLDALMNLLYLIKDEAVLTIKGEQYIELAQEELRRVAAMTRAAMSQSQNRPRTQLTNVPELLRSVVDFYTARLNSQGISIETRYCIGGDLPVELGILRQMFSNLLLNAAQAMPAGGKIVARVRIAREWTGLNRRGLRVTFADNGSGISVADLPRIAEAFFTTKGTTGMGLGLSLVKDTIDKHQGVLSVRTSTTAGRSGSVFSIFLPAF
jgi:signal transduction histidine kinase